MKNKYLLLLIASFFLVSIETQAQLTLGGYTVDTVSVARNLDTVWELIWGPDNHIWYTERNGNITRLNPATGVSKRIARPSSVYESGEAGLMSLALHPSFPDSNFVYVVYTYGTTNQIRVRLSKFIYSVALDTITSEQILINGIQGNTTHNGSRLLFGPDGFLYMTMGDAQVQTAPQNTGNLSGKTLRITSWGTAPADNPFGSYVWSFGHRNSQGLAFAPNGNLLSTEHGANAEDEINLITKGANYGWPNVEGECNTTAEITFCNANAVVEPLWSWTPTIAVAGAEVYTGAMFPTLQNKLLATTLKNAEIRVLTLSPTFDAVTADERAFSGRFGRLRDICVGPLGEIYIGTSNRDGRGVTIATSDDRILKITNAVPTGTGSAEILSNVYIYPNPGSEHFLIHGYQNNLAMLELFGPDGILKESLQIGAANITLPSVPSGLYFYQIRDTQGKVVAKNKIMIGE